jgi:hypothetical protein
MPGMISQIEKLEKDVARLIEVFCAQNGVAAKQVAVRVRIHRGTTHLQLIGLEVDVQEPNDRIPR